MSSSPPNGSAGKPQQPRSTNPRSGQNAFPQPLQLVRRAPTAAGNARNNPSAQDSTNTNGGGGFSSQYSNNFNRTADARFSTGRRETAASSRYGGFDPADYASPPSPAQPAPGVNRQRSRREQDEEEWEREQQEQRRRKNSKNDNQKQQEGEEEFDEEVPRQDIPRGRRDMPRQAPPPPPPREQGRGRPGPRRQGGGTARDRGSTASANTNASSTDEDRERDARRERIHINIDTNGTSWTSWGDDGSQRSGQFSFAGTAFGGSPFGGGQRQNSRLGPVNLPVNLPINIPGFGGFGF